MSWVGRPDWQPRCRSGRGLRYEVPFHLSGVALLGAMGCTDLLTPFMYSHKLAAMGAFIRRVLSTACCLVLVLPPGWCRFASARGARDEEEAPQQAHGGCCDLRHCKDREKCPPEPKHPTSPSRCCCYERDWLKPNPPEVRVVDLSLMAMVIPEESTCAVLRNQLCLSIPGPSPPLHLLKCAWLC